MIDEFKESVPVHLAGRSLILSSILCRHVTLDTAMIKNNVSMVKFVGVVSYLDSAIKIINLILA